MTEDEVRERAYAMPLTSPAFPLGPYRFYHREYLIITYRTDPDRLRALVPEPLRGLAVDAFLERLPELDEVLAARAAEARGRGHVLRYLARLNQRGLARVGLVEVPPTHPAARLYGTDNQFALTTTRYNTQPLVIQGPGAGPEVTAQALLGDVLALI